MSSTFDPNAGPLFFEGKFTNVAVIDPTPLGNLVLNPDEEFTVRVEWEVKGVFAPALLTFVASANWNIRVFAEPIGPGTAVELVSDNSVPVFPGGLAPYSFSKDITITPGTGLLETNPGDTTKSGIYRLVVSIFADDNTGNKLDIAGFDEGVIIHVENPV